MKVFGQRRHCSQHFQVCLCYLSVANDVSDTAVSYYKIDSELNRLYTTFISFTISFTSLKYLFNIGHQSEFVDVANDNVAVKDDTALIARKIKFWILLQKNFFFFLFMDKNILIFLIHIIISFNKEIEEKKLLKALRKNVSKFNYINISFIFICISLYMYSWITDWLMFSLNIFLCVLPHMHIGLEQNFFLVIQQR